MGSRVSEAARPPDQGSRAAGRALGCCCGEIRGLDVWQGGCGDSGGREGVLG